MISAEIFLVRRLWSIITKFPNPENHTDGKHGLMLTLTKHMSAEKVYLAETKRQKSVGIPINSSSESRRKPRFGAKASGCMASACKRMSEQREAVGAVGELWAQQKIVLVPHD
jgi:hypothetical protein